MYENNELLSRRDRTYRENESGDYFNRSQYLAVAVSFCVIHILFEFMYYYLGCIPMAIINAPVIFLYVGCTALVLKGKTQITMWAMLFEVYLHVIFATIFMGLHCGYQLWLFGTFACIFLPLFQEGLSKSMKFQIAFFAFVILATFQVLTFMGTNGWFPTKYSPPYNISRIIYHVNAITSFCTISIYTFAYNYSMSKKNREIKRAADHDYLTGIFNRHRIQIILEAEAKREHMLGKEDLSVAILDIDHFKQVNDTYGHAAGDAILKGIAEVFAGHSSYGLLYGRWGGEEFLLIAPEDCAYDDFAGMLEGIRREIEEKEFSFAGQLIHVTVSIGAAAYKDGMSVEKLVSTADDRLYTAKESGRNRVIT